MRLTCLPATFIVSSLAHVVPGQHLLHLLCTPLLTILVYDLLTPFDRTRSAAFEAVLGVYWQIRSPSCVLIDW
jgi:hypothetical protein